MACTIGECRVLKAPPFDLCDWLGSWFGGEEEKKNLTFHALRVLSTQSCTVPYKLRV